jgi:hypothetical protein
MSQSINAATDKYRLSWREDPATTMVVGWNQVSGTNPIVQYSTKKLDAESRALKTHAPDKTENYMGMNNNFARLTGLKPDTLYNFRIVDNEGTSQIMRFRTAPNKPKPFTFVAGGDSRNNRKARTDGNLIVSKLRPLFVLFGGDYSTSVKPELCQAWLDDWQATRSTDGRIYPILPTYGNHEGADKKVLNKLFDINGNDSYYALNIGGTMLRTYALNSELQFSKKDKKWKEQTKWLEKDLKDNINTTWKVVAYHRPMRPHQKNKSEMKKIINSWADMFYAYGVNLAVESDSHVVKRTYPLKPDNGPDSFESFIRDDKRGITFIGEGSWGAPLRPANDNKPWTMASGSFWQFKLIHVYKDHLDIRSIKFDNAKELIANTEKDRMNIPENLNIWTPPSGAVLRINPHIK